MYLLIQRPRKGWGITVIFIIDFRVCNRKTSGRISINIFFSAAYNVLLILQTYSKYLPDQFKDSAIL